MLDKDKLGALQKDLQVYVEGGLTEQIMSLGEKSSDPNQKLLNEASQYIQMGINKIGKVLESL